MLYHKSSHKFTTLTEMAEILKIKKSSELLQAIDDDLLASKYPDVSRKMEIQDFDPNLGNTMVKFAREQEAKGMDPNQVASAVVKAFPSARNYGIGGMVDENQRPMLESIVIRRLRALDVLTVVLSEYSKNHAEVLKKLRIAVLKWLQIPEKHWEYFLLVLTGEGGSGAVQTAIQSILAINEPIHHLVTEGDGWPGYLAMAKTHRVNIRGKPLDFIGQPLHLPIFQFGPQNPIGVMHPSNIWEKRAKRAKKDSGSVIGDIAYPGFFTAHLLKEKGVEGLMSIQYEQIIKPFVENKVTMGIGISPTKFLRTFGSRPPGFCLLYAPEDKLRKELMTAVRARGSSFESPEARALIQAYVYFMPDVIAEHEISLRRVAQAERTWKKFTHNTSLKPLFEKGFGGLFRRFQGVDGAAMQFYGRNIVPVINADGYIRANILGLPSNNAVASHDVKIFAKITA